MRTLALDTAGPVVGVAAWRDDALVYDASERIVQGADGWLAPAVAAALEAAGGVDLVAVSVGPGAFTGLRVGVATALGLAVARGVPVVPLSSLAVRAAAVPGEAAVLVLLDARKGRVYAGRFDTRGEHPVALGPIGDIPPEEALTGPPCPVVGEGGLVYASLLAARAYPLAAAAGASAVGRTLPLIRSVPAVPPAGVTLAYLRPPDAVPPKGVPRPG